MATKTSTRKREQWVRSFTVSDPVTHPKGFTIYKVTYMGFVINKPEETIEVTVWKRYNDFKKLYKALFTIHQQMRRPETFPPFAKAKLFGRFDNDVIEERQRSSLKLLEFAATKSYLVKSNFFVNFFEGGEKRLAESRGQPVDKNILLPDVLTQDRTTKELSPSETIESSSGASSPNLGRQVSEASNLGGVWLHRQHEDDEEDPLAELRGLGTDSDPTGFDNDNDDDRTTFSEDSVPSTPLPQVQDVSFFDPLNDSDLPAESKDGIMSHSSSWLFEAMDMCAGLQKETSLPPVSDPPTDDAITLNFPSQSNNDQPVDCADGILESNDIKVVENASINDKAVGTSIVPARKDDHHAKSMARAYLNCIRAQQAAERDEQLGVDGGIVDSRNALVQQLPIGVQNKALHDLATRDRTASNISVSTMDLGGEDDYLYKAASHIKLALENEATGNYKSAFTYYKTGVNVLLQGVVTDNNKARREAVRRKTAQYLMKAEDLYKKFLSAEAANIDRWNSDQFHVDMDHNSLHLRGSFDDLKNFKVIGIIDRVLLVLDMVSNQMFVIKVLQKCAVPSKKRKTCVPVKCRFMVQLCQYFETENAIYLVIEHASGGKLWDYVSGYLRQEEDAMAKQSLTNSLDRSRNSSRASKRSRDNSVLEEIAIEDGEVFESTADKNDLKDIHSTVEPAVNSFEPNPEIESKETSPVPDNNQDCASSYVELVTDYTHNINSLTSDETILKEPSEKNSKEPLSNNQDFTDDTMPSVAAPNLSILNTTASDVESDVVDETDDLSMSTLMEKCLQYDDDNLQTQPDNVFVDNQEASLPQTTPDRQPPPMCLFSIDSLESDFSSPEHVMNGDIFSFDPRKSGRTLKDIPEDNNTSKSNSSRKLDFDRFPENEAEVSDSNEVIDDVLDSIDNSQTKKPSGYFMEDIEDNVPNLLDSFIHKTPDTSGFGIVMDATTMSSGSSIDGDSSELLQSVEVTCDSTVNSADDFLVVDLVDNSAICRTDNSTNRPILQTQTSKSNLNVSGMGKGCFPGIDNDNQIEGEPESTKEVLNLPESSPPEDDTFSVFVNPFEKYESSEAGSTTNKLQFNTWVSIEDSPDRKPSVTIPKGIPTPVCSPTRKTSVDSNKKENTTEMNEQKENLENNVGKKTLTDNGITGNGIALSRDRTMSVLFEHLDNEQLRVNATLPESCIRFWIAEIVLALEDLHSMGIICRDLNPSNILLGERGHIRLSYFSIWQYVEDDAKELAIDNLYSAPEVNGIYKVTQACDWWTVGTLLFELLTGKTLHNCHPSGINSHTELKIPDHVSKEAKSLLKQLLLVNPSERLGSGLAGSEDIKNHPFFRDVNWKTLTS
ncbi:ribosomal protein S6 kinase delta-1-like [Antedon mediterranea]|uniref:ribosomal protein S6 kinase delta-1-like n=1 Tax=Antedon mediterranea TaxID=105859 RepID=UPI003AF913CB